MVNEVWVPTAGDRILLEGVIADTRDGFALVTVTGSQPPGTYISVDYAALAPAAPPAALLEEAPVAEPGLDPDL